MLDAFVAAGHNFLDTADVYGDGASEQTLAPWLARRRDEVVVATKVRFPVSDPGGSGLAPERIVRRATPRCGGWGSTSSTSTRSTRPTPTSRSRTRWRRSTASCAPARCARSAPRTSPPGCWRGPSRVQDREGFSPFVSLQPQYSLVERSIETEILPFCRAAGLGVLPWGPLGAGFLTGRYERDDAAARRHRASATPPDDLEEALHRRGDRGQLPRRRRGARGRRRARGERRAGRDRLAAGPARRHRADPRPAHARAARGPAARRRAGADRRAGRAARALHRPRARLSRAHEHRAERHRRRHRAAALAPERLQEILQ